MTVGELDAYFREHWVATREQLLLGHYAPMPVKRVEIPKSGVVNHDILMGRLEKRIGDKRVLGLVRRYLEAGVLVHGVAVERHEGTPQGGPLSPLLANVLLDDVDKELEKRGHSFVRYADDSNVYVASEKAGKRVMALLRKLYGNLRLKVNEAKSAVGPAAGRKILGYEMWNDSKGAVKLGVATKTMGILKEKVRAITRRSGGRSIQAVVEDLKSYLPGWKNYFALAETPKVFRELDGWIRHRLRQLHLKQWKRGTTVYRELVSRGTPEWVARQVAASTKSWWKSSSQALNTALPIRYFDALEVPKLAK